MCEENTEFIGQVTSEKDITDTVFATEKCDLSFRYPGPYERLKTCDYFISTCNVTGSWKVFDVRLDIACHMYLSKFKHEQYVFRNVFCAMCNGMSPDTVTCDVHYNLKTDIFSFSGLLNLDFEQGFSTDSLQEDRLKQETSCTANQLYDPLMNRCKDVYCPEMRVQQNGRCVNVYRDIIDYFAYTLYVRFKPLTIQTVGDAVGNESNWLLEIGEIFQANYSDMSLCEAQLAFKSDVKFGKVSTEVLSQSKLLYVDAKICLATWNKQPWKIADELLKIHDSTFSFYHDSDKSSEYLVNVMDTDDRLFKIIKRVLGDIDFHGQILSSSTVEKRVDILSKYAMADTDGLTKLPYSIFFPLNMACNSRTTLTEIDVIRFSSCPKVNISNLDIPWTKSTDGLIINDLRIPSNEYYHSDNIHIMTCTKTFQKIVNHLQPKRTFNAEVLVSIISCSLSISSLLITFVIFCILPKLRTPLPGKNNMSLVASLIVAQALLLTGSLAPFEQYSWPCKFVGVLIHFSWLCAIFWMNVCTYHMFRVLSKTALTGYGWKRFIFYHIYVFLMSLLFVLTNILSSVFISGNIGYGGKFCYMISAEKILFTFGIPTMLVIIVNINMFLFVFIKIKRAPNIRKHVQNDHNEIVIFAKLSTLTGITWVFGFLYIWSNLQALSYIFTVLNAGQGVFIMFAFILNRNVMIQLREKFQTSHKSLQRTSGSGAGTVSSKI